MKLSEILKLVEDNPKGKFNVTFADLMEENNKTADEMAKFISFMLANSADVEKTISHVTVKEVPTWDCEVIKYTAVDSDFGASYLELPEYRFTQYDKQLVAYAKLLKYAEDTGLDMTAFDMLNPKTKKFIPQYIAHAKRWEKRVVSHVSYLGQIHFTEAVCDKLVEQLENGKVNFGFLFGG